MLYKLLLIMLPLFVSGTELLAANTSADTLKELTTAVALYPNLARNHNNLVCAYIALEKWDRAWYHSRQAVLCSVPDGLGTYYFDFFCNKLFYEQGLQAAGTEAKKILEELGIPEMAMYGLDGHTLEMCTYGLLSIKFKEGKLVECKRLDQVKL